MKYQCKYCSFNTTSQVVINSHVKGCHRAEIYSGDCDLAICVAAAYLIDTSDPIVNDDTTYSGGGGSFDGGGSSDDY